MNAKILKARVAVRQALARQKLVEQKQQLVCKHKHVAECSYVSSTHYSDAEPPVRMCLDCGLAEDGWSCGYVVLKNADETVGRIERERVWAERSTYIRDCHKGPLLRGETTLKHIIMTDGADL
jgi:hypothetical protein